MYPIRVRVLVTGAAGGIGSKLVTNLLRDGFQVIGVDDFSGCKRNLGLEAPGYKFFEIDLSGKSLDLLGTLGEVDIVYHLAGKSSLAYCQKDPLGAHASNVQSTIQIAEYARAIGAGVVFSSTSAVYEGLQDRLFEEDTKLAPSLTYPVTKLFAETILESYEATYGLPSIRLRLFNVFGEDQDITRTQPPFVNYLFREVAEGRRPIVFAPLSQQRDYVYIADVVEALRASGAAVGEKRSGTYNVCTSRPISIDQILDAFARGASLQKVFFDKGDPKDFWNAYEELHSGKYVIDRQKIEDEVLKHSVGSYRKAHSELGWEPQHDVLEAIERYAARIRIGLAQ